MYTYVHDATIVQHPMIETHIDVYLTVDILCIQTTKFPIGQISTALHTLKHRYLTWLTHWGRVTHICVSELTIIGSDNGLSPGRRLAIIWNNAGLLLSEPLGTNVSEISIGIQTFTFKKMHLNMSSAKWRPFFLGLNVLRRERATNLCADVLIIHVFAYGSSCTDSRDAKERMAFYMYTLYTLTRYSLFANQHVDIEHSYLLTRMIWMPV